MLTKFYTVKFSGKIILALLSILSLKVNGQVLSTSVPFSAATPFLEPDGRREVLKISDTEFVVISKVKGNMNGESTYSLEKHDSSLKNYFKIPFVVAAEEDIKDMFFNGVDLIVFTIVHRTDVSESKLLAYGFDASTGAKKWDKVLMQFKVTSFQSVRSRGSVEETFENAIASSLNKNYIVPFEYQYDLQFSPDGNKIIAYTFDYAKPNMIANAAIFDKNLNKLSEGIVPIDNNFINYGIFINNRGDVHILNVDKLGRIVLIQYNLETKDNKLLDIQYASTQREGLKLCFISDDEIFVGCTNTSDGKLAGVMYSKFNFNKNLVEKINFHKMGDGLLQTASAARGSNKNAKGEENWLNYEITNFYVNKYEKVLMVLEKREVNGYEYMYKSESVLEPDRWKERIAKVNTEGVLFFSFNASDDLMWENYYLKMQTADIAIGMTSSSFLLDVNDEMIRMVYATGDNAAGVYNTYNFVQWDATNGNKVKDLTLENDDKLSLVRNYGTWWGNKVVLVGRKGLLGKKYIMNSYEIATQ